MSRNREERARPVAPRWRRTVALLALAVASLHAQAGSPAQPSDPASLDLGRYRLQSNPWVNLHQRLMQEARFDAAPPVALAGEDLAKWRRGVEAYRAYLGKRHPLFDEELIALNTALSGLPAPPADTAPALPVSIPTAAAGVLEAAMPLYLAAQWQQDDRANRFWIALAEPLLGSAGEELAAAHAKAYGVPFPTRILVDVTEHAGQFGAYTVGEGDSAHAVISSREAGYQGFKALEMLMHEPSHAIVGSDSHAIGSELVAASRELGIRPMANLWHALLFYTSGELTRAALARRGIVDYRPNILAMYDGPYRGFRESIETHWQAYLDGKGSREAAIRQILIETAPPKK